MFFKKRFLSNLNFIGNVQTSPGKELMSRNIHVEPDVIPGSHDSWARHSWVT